MYQEQDSQACQQNTGRENPGFIRLSYQQQLLQKAQSGEPIRLCETQALKLMSMLLNPQQHGEAVLLIEHGIPKQWELNRGHFGETLSLLAGLGITQGFLQPVAPEWKNI